MLVTYVAARCMVVGCAQRVSTTYKYINGARGYKYQMYTLSSIPPKSKITHFDHLFVVRPFRIPWRLPLFNPHLEKHDFFFPTVNG